MSDNLDLEVPVAPVAEGAGCHAGADTMRDAAAQNGPDLSSCFRIVVTPGAPSGMWMMPFSTQW